MITPADLARMLDHASPRHALDSLAPDRLMYTSETSPAKQATPTRACITPSDVFGRARRCGQRDDAPCDGDAGNNAAETTHAADADAVTPVEADVHAHATTTGDINSDITIGADIAVVAADADKDTATATATALAAAVASDRTIIAATIVTAARRPSPANMPPRRTSDGPTTFASLDAQELPVVREYSAGGLVFDEHGRVAIIARHSRSGHLEWCLPKGHIEKGETPQQTAVREVHEETGILGEVVDSIATIDYWFTGTTQRVHKLVHHYALRQIGGHLTVEGDPDHEAEDAIWVDFADLDGVLSYPNERKIAWLYARKLNRQA